MKPSGNKVILRYKKEDLEAVKKTVGGLYLDTSFNPNEHVCQVATIEGDSERLNKDYLLFKGDVVLVQYLVGLDTFTENKTDYSQDIEKERALFFKNIDNLLNNGMDTKAKKLTKSFESEYTQYDIKLKKEVTLQVKRNQFFIEKDGEDEIRWCDISQIFGKKTKDGFMPLFGFVMCDLLPTIPEHYHGGIIIKEQKVDTEKKAYITSIRYIHPLDSDRLGVNVGDRVFCTPNSDAIKDVFGEKLLRVPSECILGINV